MGAGASKSEVSTLKSTVASLTKRIKELETQTIDDKVIKGITTSLDYSKLGQNVDMTNLTKEVLKDPAKITAGIVTEFKDKPETLTKISTALSDDTKFAKTLADTLTDSSSQYRKALQGDKGETGELSTSKETVKTNLYDKKYTLWCADGDFCELPVGKKGIKIGDYILGLGGDNTLRMYKGTNPDDYGVAVGPKTAYLKFDNGYFLYSDGSLKLMRGNNNVHSWWADGNQSAYNNFQVVGDKLEIGRKGANAEIQMGDWQYYGYGGGPLAIRTTGQKEDQLQLFKDDFMRVWKWNTRNGGNWVG